MFISLVRHVHPIATTWHFPSRGNEKIGGTGYCVTYDIESQSRNADFISIACPTGNPQPSAAEPLSPPERKRTQPFYTTRGVSRAPFLKIAAPAATATLGPKGRQTYEPSGRQAGPS